MTSSYNSQSFGRHIRSLRRVRNLTQEQLAERCGLSTDTIRRLEHGSFSPSLETMRKLCHGLQLRLSTLFESYELQARQERRELDGLLVGRGPKVLAFIVKIVRALLEEIDALLEARRQDEEEDA